MLTKVDTGLWVYDGPSVQFYHVPFPTRMVVVQLDNNELWIHSPCHLDTELQNEIEKLGVVKYLISPNKLHHLFLKEWIDAYPESKCYASPGVAQKRPDILFYKELSDTPETQWQGMIEQLVFRGSFAMEEVIFYHRNSKTLIVTDLVENFAPHSLNCIQRIFARIAGILAPNGKTPLDWRLTFIFNKKVANSCLQNIISWKPERLIMSHGQIIEKEATEFLQKSFSWLKANY